MRLVCNVLKEDKRLSLHMCVRARATASVQLADTVKRQRMFASSAFQGTQAG